jgi:hypothetical protein
LIFEVASILPNMLERSRFLVFLKIFEACTSYL